MPSVICLLAILAFVFAVLGLVRPGQWTQVAVVLVALIELIHCVPLR